ncbi:MAG: SGNH/GDSL hydrolase family protein [Tenacibaculum sp.]
MKKKVLGGLLGLVISFVACDVNNDLEEIEVPIVPEVSLEKGDLDFSNYIAVGASFTAGFTDAALFIKGQENSFPNILASKFAMAGGGEFSQPLMADNIGGMIFFDSIFVGLEPRLVLNIESALPERLDKVPTTQLGEIASNAPNFNNYGIPGAKSFHLLAPGYGSTNGLTTDPITANPYYVRMSPTQPTLLEEVVSKKPTFFTLSEIGGNDVLSYAINGGDDSAYTDDLEYYIPGVNQTGNTDLSTYGPNDITDPTVFTNSFAAIVKALKASDVEGVVTTIPDITLLPHFTTVPYNPLDPRQFQYLADNLVLLNSIYGFVNKVAKLEGKEQRIVEFKPDQSNPLILLDLSLEPVNLSVLASDEEFISFIEKLLDVSKEEAASLAFRFSILMSFIYSQARSATKEDLIVLSGALVIGEVNQSIKEDLVDNGVPENLADQIAIEGITFPLSGQWWLNQNEIKEIKTATDAYNASIKAIVKEEGLALVDFDAVLNEALSSNGISFDEFNLTGDLVLGGLFSLDGIHLTARGYALMANKILEAIDDTYGSNFKEATNGLAKAKDFVTNYSPNL